MNTLGKLEKSGKELLANNFSEDFLTKNNIYYSIITEIELLSFPKLSESEIENIKLLLNRFLKLSLTEDIKEKTIEIRKKYKRNLGDSLIAASALVYNAKLITRNEEDFSIIILTHLDY